MPAVAKAIYHKYCEPDSRVIDFSAGYGGRLFGALACQKVSSYTGVEVNSETVQGLHNLNNYIKEHFDTKKEVNIFYQDSINGMKMFADKSFDLCFTSPPYFDAEEYSDDEGQSSMRHTKYGDWFEKYLSAAIGEAFRVAKKVVINIGNTGSYMIANDLRDCLQKGDIPFTEDKLRLPGSRGSKFKFDSLFVIDYDTPVSGD